jgi:hypothetical protein
MYIGRKCGRAPAFDDWKRWLKVLPMTMTPGGIIAAEEPRISAWSLRLLSAELVREALGTPAKVSWLT